VDLERRSPVDLLPDREADTIATWLKEHPGVEIISRDRAGAYADGARRGAPNAILIADRFLQNLTQAVERYLQTRQSCLQAAAKACQPSTVESAEEREIPATAQRLTKLELWNERREQRHEEVQELWRQGATIRSIAERFGMHRRTVRLLVKAEKCPRRLAPTRRNSQLDDYIGALAQQWAAGCHNSAEMYRELRRQGFRGSESAVRKFIGQWRKELPADLKRRRRGPQREVPANPRAKKFVPSARRTAWILLRDPEKLEAE
jgi:transposase